MDKYEINPVKAIQAMIKVNELQDRAQNLIKEYCDKYPLMRLTDCYDKILELLKQLKEQCEYTYNLI